MWTVEFVEKNLFGFTYLFYDRSSRIIYREKPDWVVTDFGKIYVRHPRCLHEPTCEPLSPIDKSTNMSANKMAGTEQEDV